MKLTVILLCFLLCACTSKWEPIGPVEWTYQEADSQCEFDSFKRFQFVTKSPKERCMKQLRKMQENDECGKEKTYEEKVPKTESYVLDVNKDSRHREYMSCMKRKGWQEKISTFGNRRLLAFN